jgi:PAS domain S-box-containing protein
MASDEKFLKTILASIGDAVISTDSAGRVVFANAVAESLLRSASGDILGKQFDDVFRLENELTRAKLESPVAKVLREGTIVGLENHTVLIAHDGTEVPIDDNAAPVRDENGDLQGVVLVFRDITTRRRAEEARRLLTLIVESSDDAIISKDLNGTITSWNKGAERIFEYAAKEVIGKPISILAPPDRIDEMPVILQRIRNGERVDHYETVRRAKSGRRVNISLTVSPVRDPEGNIIGASKIARDITEQVRSRVELAEQREWTRVAFNSIGDAVITTDKRATVTYLNPVAADLTGWQTSEAAGKPLEEVFRIVNEESRRTVENPTTRALREGIIVGLANHTVLISRDGKEHSIDDSAAPIRNDRGEVLGVILIFRDVTERRAGLKRLEMQAAELQRTNEELNNFASAVSHDLREPLRNVVNFSQLLVREGDDRKNSATQEYAEYVVEGVNRMEMLLNDLLAYSQVGGREQPARLTDVNEIVKTTLENLQAMIAETGAQVSSSHLPHIVGYEAQLSQLFQNLIGNAIKYRSERPPRVHISAEKRGHEWIFKVSDNGIGIAHEYHKTIFGVFKRLHGKETPGTGIGLAICSKVVEHHGGRIWVESKPGEGSEFLFTLPESLRSTSEERDPD